MKKFIKISFILLSLFVLYFLGSILIKQITPRVDEKICPRVEKIPECSYGLCPTYEFSWDLDQNGHWESFINVPTTMNKAGAEIWIVDEGKLVFKVETETNMSVFTKEERVFISYVSEYSEDGIYPLKGVTEEIIFSDNRYQLINKEEHIIK